MSARKSIVLLPGLLCDAATFEPQIAALSDSCNVQVADFFGYNNLTQMAEYVLEIAPAEFVLAGFSMGGRVALEVMRLAPERVTGLAIFDTGTNARQPGEEAKRQVLVDLANTKGMRALADKWLPPMLHPDRQSDAAFVENLTAMVCRATPEIHAAQIKALLDRPDAGPVLRTIRCPTIVLCGRDDLWSPPEQHVTITAEIAGAELVIAEHCGHFLPVEAPSILNAALASLVHKS
ncbi:MAG: hydrolase [Hyphomicrobiales bacterium]|nr:hydrolase [Hyphomicrobiales bacterium]